MVTESPSRWMLVEMVPRAGGYERGQAPALLRLEREPRWVDIRTSPLFGVGGNGLGPAHGLDVAFEIRFAESAVLSLQMSSGEIHELDSNESVFAFELDPPVAVIPEQGSGKVSVAPQQEEVTPSVKRVSAEAAWYRTQGEFVKVALLDTGVGEEHPDLMGLPALNFVPGGLLPDVLGHGTRCAGILSARKNGFGMIGVAPAAELHSLKVVSDAAEGRGGWLAAALFWCVVYQVRVASISLAFPGVSSILAWLFSVFGEEVLIVAAAGNADPSSGDKEVQCPARLDGVLAVSAIDGNNKLATFSCWGPAIDLAAPGTSVKTTELEHDFHSWDGTSMACPHVAGAAALVFSRFPSSSPRWVEHRLKASARDLGSPGQDPSFGYGLVDANKATK